ncbi:MAG TPA: AtpZ/AtpI family protein [Candidatus Bipolaricaulota bacterium]|nr:AtpZ/AtpI family protein [Candidatus Bipolaricaulota bacterium]
MKFIYFEKMENDKEKDKKPWVFALGLTFQLGYTIAVPLVALALIGRFLDERFETSPWLLLIGIILSLFISSWLIYFKIIKIFAEINKDDDKKEAVGKRE